MKKYYTVIVIFIILMLAPFMMKMGICQPPPPPPVQDIPIDGGLSALLFAGMAFGARKLYKKRKKQD
jgi:hypothetical protein